MSGVRGQRCSTSGQTHYTDTNHIVGLFYNPISIIAMTMLTDKMFSFPRSPTPWDMIVNISITTVTLVYIYIIS